METSLHKQLKQRYASREDQTEVVVDGFRIDAIADNGELIEIQHASLGALRDKTRKLLKSTRHRVRIVKPVLAKKRISTLDKRDGEVIRSRMSPKRGQLIDFFEDMVHFSNVFPMKRLILEIVLVESEEFRLDRARPTRRRKKYKTVDQALVDVRESVELRTKSDLLNTLDHHSLPSEFDTAQLAEAIGKPRWFAQKVAYCLRETEAIRLHSKRGNNLIYRFSARRRRAA